MKRILSIFLCIFLLFSFSVVSVSATDPTFETWLGWDGISTEWGNAILDEIGYVENQYPGYDVIALRQGNDVTILATDPTKNGDSYTELENLSIVFGSYSLYNIGNCASNAKLYVNGMKSTVAYTSPFSVTRTTYSEANSLDLQWAMWESDGSYCDNHQIIYTSSIIYNPDYDESTNTGTVYYDPTPINYSTIYVNPGYAVSFTSTNTPRDYDFTYYCNEGDVIGTPAFAFSSMPAYNQYDDVTNLVPIGSYNIFNDATRFMWELERTSILKNIISMNQEKTVTLTATGNTYTFYNLYKATQSSDSDDIRYNGKVAITFDNSLTLTISSIISDSDGYVGLGLAEITAGVDEGGNLVDGDGNPLIDGGNINDQNPGEYVVGDDTGFSGVVTDILNGIRSIFTESLSRLFEFMNIGTEFGQKISEIFFWLPSPIPEFITTGILIYLATSFIKFLRG